MSAVPHPEQFLASKQRAKVRVTLPNDSVVELNHPHVRGNMLTGFSHDKYLQIPMADVKLMQANVPAVGRTVLLAGVGAVALGVVVSQGSASSHTGTCLELARDNNNQVVANC